MMKHGDFGILKVVIGSHLLYRTLVIFRSRIKLRRKMGKSAGNRISEKKKKRKHKKDEKKYKKKKRDKAKKLTKDKTMKEGKLDDLMPPSTYDNDEGIQNKKRSSADIVYSKEEEAPAIKKARSMVPMRKEDWEAQESVIREVVDPITGRTRLVKGSGEILERIVSRQQHTQINRQATKGDGASFMAGILGQATARRHNAI